MSKPILQLHTIDQWMELDKTVQAVILQNIRLKDRLHQFLKDNWKKKGVPVDFSQKWAPCIHCETRGWVSARHRLPGIHPSQIPHPCMLKIYNEIVGKEGEDLLEPKSMLIFDAGHAFHDMLQRYGKRGAWGPDYTPEVPIGREYTELAEELGVEGSADAENVLVIDDIPESPYIYEVGLVHEYKTINHNAFEKLTRPKPEHKTQASIYAAALNRPIVAYLYINKNDSNITDFPVAFDPEIWVHIEAKIRTLKSHLDSQTEPPATVGFHCQQCPFVFNCETYKAAKILKGGSKKGG